MNALVPAAAASLLTVLTAWLVLSSGSWGDLRVPASILPYAICLSSIALGLCVFASISHRKRAALPTGRAPLHMPERGDALIAGILMPIVALTLVGTILLLSAPTEVGQPSPIQTTVVLLLGAAALMAMTALLIGLASGQGLEVETHWGGLGGSLGGWSLSSPLVALLLVLTCLGGVIAMYASAPNDSTEDPPKAKPDRIVAPGPTGDITGLDKVTSKAPAADRQLADALQNSEEPGGGARKAPESPDAMPSPIADANAGKITNEVDE